MLIVLFSKPYALKHSDCLGFIHSSLVKLKWLWRVQSSLISQVGMRVQDHSGLATHTFTLHSQQDLQFVEELAVQAVLLLAGRSCHFLQVCVLPSCNQSLSFSHSEGTRVGQGFHQSCSIMVRYANWSGSSNVCWNFSRHLMQLNAQWPLESS